MIYLIEYVMKADDEEWEETMTLCEECYRRYGGKLLRKESAFDTEGRPKSTDCLCHIF